MKDFLLVFRAAENSGPKSSPEQMQANMKLWMDWIGGIAAQNKLVDRGNRLEASGKVLRAGHVVTDGPFMEVKESIGGYTIVKADSAEDATKLSEGCPILAVPGGSVEIREIGAM